MQKGTSKLFAFALGFLAAGAIFTGAVLREKSTNGSIDWGNSANHVVLMADSQSNSVDIPESVYFAKLIELLQAQYVEKPEATEKLAIGAVKGMVVSLQDPLATFMDKTQFEAFANAMHGKFEGIGAELKFEFDPTALEKLKKRLKGEGVEDLDSATLIPNVVVSAIVPGSNAAKAGLKIGDQIIAVDGKTVLSTAMVESLRSEIETVRKSKLDENAMNLRLRSISDRFTNSTTPLRVKDHLTLGATGESTVEWERGTNVFNAKIAKARQTWEPIQERGDAVEVRFFDGADRELASRLDDKKALTIDLRNSTQGSFETLQKMLDLVAPAGVYGEIVTDKNAKPTRLVSQGQRTTPLDLTLIVDKSTRGAAEVFALALQSRKLAKIVGGPTAGEKAIIKTVLLPDGSGYTLPVGEFHPVLDTKVARAEREVRP
ncbi:MAG: PDZ domain-containing protein [Chthonomonas sp.]|nr:PDZ domain-containing protein [Chthonomonas sp.]